MLKRIKSLVIILLILASISLATAIDISSCQTISSPGTYVLTQNLSTTSTCIIIKSDNVIIDGDGFTISGNSASKTYGIDAKQYDNIEIRNIIINDFEYGVRLDSVKDTDVDNVILNDNIYGIKLETSSSSSIKNSVIHHNTIGIALVANSDLEIMQNELYENHDEAMSVKTTSNSKLSMNNIHTNERGILLSTSSNNEIESNTLKDNNIALDISSSSYNTFNNLEIDLNKDSIMLDSSTNNIFSNTVIANSQNKDISLKDSSSGNVIINTSYDISKEDVEAASKLTRKWFIDIKVIDNATQNAVSNSDVKIWDRRGDLIISGKTENQGILPNVEITDYTNNGRRQISSNPYIIFASKNGFTDASSTTDIKENGQIILKLTDLNPPLSPPLTNIFTVPEFPFINQRQAQNVLVHAHLSKSPLAYRFKLFNENAELVHTTSSGNITSQSDLPLTLSIPAGLEIDTYTVVLETTDQDNTITDLNIGMFFVIMPQEPLPFIADVTTVPSFPITLNPGTSQDVLVNFTMDDENIEVQFLIYKDTELVYNSSIMSVNMSSFPLTFTIPSTLATASHTAVMLTRDTNNTNNITLGSINIVSQQSGPSGGGGGGGGGSLGVTRASNRTLNNTNITLDDLNNTRANETTTPPNNQSSSKSPISLITGAVTGLIGNKKFITVFLFIVVIICSYILIRLNTNAPAKPDK